MSNILTLLQRDMKKNIGKRFILMTLFMVLFQCWFIFGSGTFSELRETGTVELMGIVFSFFIFGSIAATTMNYDTVSRERENKVMDYILTSPVSKTQVIVSKITTLFISSMIFSVAYLCFIILMFLLFSGKNLSWWIISKYTLPVGIFMFIYSMVGFMCSIALRSSKASFIICIVLGSLFMPRLLVTIVEGIGKVLSLSEAAVTKLSMISPAMIMSALIGGSQQTNVTWGIILAVFYFVMLIGFSILIFNRQDEMNYGE
jgi:hypothetical protein